MTKSILKITAVLFATSLVATGCNTPAEKVEHAQENVTEANNDLNKANEAYLADVETYRIETTNKINSNNQSIIDFNARIDGQKKEAKADYRKKVAELETKNSDMKKRMEDYKADSKENWESFKTEFNHDMDELGNAFRDLTIDNKK
jgi:hypothetical protein